MLGMKNHFDINDSIEIREVDIAGVAYSFNIIKCENNSNQRSNVDIIACFTFTHDNFGFHVNYMC